MAVSISPCFPAVPTTTMHSVTNHFISWGATKNSLLIFPVILPRPSSKTIETILQYTVMIQNYHMQFSSLTRKMIITVSIRPAEGSYTSCLPDGTSCFSRVTILLFCANVIIWVFWSEMSLSIGDSFDSYSDLKDCIREFEWDNQYHTQLV